MENKAKNDYLIPFGLLPKQEMTKDNAVILLKLLRLDDSSAQAIYVDIKSNSWQEQAIDKRVDKILNLKVTPQLKVWICLLSSGCGFALPLSIYYYIAMKNESKRLVTLNDFCQNIMPNGIPILEKVNELWDKTKIDGIPILDCPHFCKSFI